MEWNEVVNGIPLIFVVMGLVELAKVFGASGKLLTGISVGIGLVLGVLMLADPLRPEAAATVAELRRRGLRLRS